MGKNNVTSSNPKISGAVYVGSVDATIPASVSAALTGFTNLGYVSDAGIVNTNSMSTEKVRAWGGDVVLDVQTEKNDEFKFTLLESLNVDVLKEIYGASNVSGTLATGITIKANSTELSERAFVFDMILKDGNLKRIVIPIAKITAVDDITYATNSPVAYGITISAHPDDSGNTHYEYISAPASAQAEE